MSKPKVFLTLSWLVFAVAAVIKVLIGTGYRSTDFEVHRNWLAITHSLPLSQWYFDETSPWTLDYPPFFAYFEWLLSQVAVFFDSGMLKVTNLGYDSVATILFQRGSVIVTDIVLLLGTYRFVEANWHDAFKPVTADDNGAQRLLNDLLDIKSVRIIIITLLNAGLFMLDHIHFQYNGMLLGILLHSLAAIKAKRPLESAVWFALLLQFKHIFLYIAPIYGIYLLRTYCLGRARWWDLTQLQVRNILKLGFVLLLIFGASLGPFVALGQLGQLFSRLFPFKRGLVHAYWAPNAWALYMFADLILAKTFGIRSETANATSGIVGATNTLVLPTVTPFVTVVLTIAAMLPLLWKVWRRPNKETFLFVLIPLSLCSFLFGWHVHEKAILITLIPFGLIAFERQEWANSYQSLALAGNLSLLPLFVNQNVSFIPIILLFGHVFVLYNFTKKYFDRVGETQKTILEFEKQHPEAATDHHDGKTRSANKRAQLRNRSLFAPTLAGTLILLPLTQFFLPILLPAYEFLPLLLTSVFCALVITAEFVRLYTFAVRL